MHNPLRSEAEAFRWVVAIVIGAATVVALTLLTSALAGAIWALILIGTGIAWLYMAARGADREAVMVTKGGDGKHRVLLMANQTVRSPELIAAAVAATQGKPSEILLVVPALPKSRADLWASDTDEAAELARQRMELTVLDLREHRRKARGEVGDSDPNVALADALAQFPADEILISTLPEGRSHWLEGGVVDRAREEISLPVRHLIWDPEAQLAQQSPQPTERSAR